MREDSWNSFELRMAVMVIWESIINKALCVQYLYRIVFFKEDVEDTTIALLTLNFKTEIRALNWGTTFEILLILVTW